MPIAVDFGTSNTLVAQWDRDSNAVRLLDAPEISRPFSYAMEGHARSINVTPTLIHYGDESLIGQQVLNEELVDSPETFRWLKIDMLRDNKRSRRVGDQRISYRDAASACLSRILMFTLDTNMLEEDLVLTVPVECYDHYVEWLSGAVASVYKRNLQFVDEATACILGYNERVRSGEIYLIVDFGGGTLDISLVRTDFDTGEQRKCCVLGRSGEELGGMMIDQWMLAELGLERSEVNAIGQKLLTEIEEAKIKLSYDEHASVSVYSPYSDRVITHRYSRADLQQILQKNRFFELVVATIDRALEQGLAKYGTSRSEVRQVLLVGGTSLIPAVREQLEHLFPGKIHAENPFSAIAEGACRYIAQDYNPAIVHDYCLRSWDRDNRQDSYTTIIPKGTQYPTDKPVKAIYINASHEGQDRLGLLLYEISAMARTQTSFVVGSDGRLDLSDDARRRIERQQPLNPENREFILADPSCKRGDRRFVAAFGVDEQKCLTISIRDTHEGAKSRIIQPDGSTVPLPVKNYPVIRLSR